MSNLKKTFYELSGLSTDVKPVPEDICHGSTYFELDTGMRYFYDEQLGTWTINLSVPAGFQPQFDRCPPIHQDAPYLVVGILDIKKIYSEENIDFYSINYTNGTSTTFTVTNAKQIDIDEESISQLLDFLWKNSETYNIGDIVFYHRAIYSCIRQVEENNQIVLTPDQDPIHWTKINFNTN